ncbi:hypothetical protein BDV95DRAFT_600438 [Massariosphaeria phaeospora]|uniref:Uncharacterized protein n=1 Tax=Massariosphaeria phaeospora TaxID=100035 RepID=A0A7C8IEM9_9PLEO|nr:hypothetical protein BDV95DRAFT_600438 [Massariosphaeria phaeospora]
MREDEGWKDHLLAGTRRELDSIQDSLDNYYLRPGGPWGFVVFRTVYGDNSEAPWARFIEHLRDSIAEPLLSVQRTDLSTRHELTIIEDEETLAGADSHTGWEDGDTDDGVEEVGWMYTDVVEYVRWYECLIAPHEWREFYQRAYKDYVNDL